MPFTVSHAAAVLPFRRSRLVWAALIIGSFGPDFEYFLRMSSESRAWHHYPEVFLYCLPFTIIAFVLFQLFVKRPLTALLPDSFERRVKPPAPSLPSTLSEAFLLVVSLLIGIVTHVAWDACTHPHTWPADHISVLRQEIVLPMGHRMFGWEISQDISSLLGLVILGVFILVWLRRTPASNRMVIAHSPAYKIAVWIGIALIALAGGTWHSIQAVGAPGTLLHTSPFDVVFVISVMAWFLWELLAYGLLMTLLQQKRAHR